jgi:D-alanyl-D-alanine dipeptidase
LPAITDAQAIAFEGSVGSTAVVNTEGLTAATARALARFQKIIAAIGGTLRLTSAYRPSPYQEHLQAVWDKWMLEFRHNQDPGCQSLRAEVEQEFTRHQLLETQRPVPFSDHTRGIGFDAAVTLPNSGRHRRRVGPDRLARLAGLRRPDVLHDPVHFRFVGKRV